MKGDPDPQGPNPPRAPPAAIVIHRNPLDPTDRVTRAAEPGRMLIDWLLEHYPAGFGRPISILWNGRDCPIEHSDRRIAAGDVIGIYCAPGEPVSITIGTLITQALIAAAITIIATLAITLIFGKPRKPGSTPAADPVYSLSGASNSARLGEPVPVIYGKVITVPDWASQPYTYFQDNNQYLAEILVLGQGRYQVDAVILGDTPTTALGDPSAVTWQFFDDSQHLNAMGNIEAATGIMENVISAPEVADQELTGAIGSTGSTVIEAILTAAAPSTFTIQNVTKPATLPGTAFDVWDVVDVGGGNPNTGKLFNVTGYNPTTGVITVAETTVINDPRAVDQYLQFAAGGSAIVSGPFVVGKPGVRGNRVMLDFVFPSGLFKLSNTGKLTPRSVDLTILIQPIDDAGASAGSAILHSETITRAANTPQRLTFTYDVPNGRYSVKVTRLTPAPSETAVVDNFVWTGLKFRLLNATGSVYGNATLLAIKIRATNGIADAASSRVRVACQRKLAPLGSGAIAVTRDPADAFVDAMTHTAYGARRPLTEVDTATLGALKTHWANRAKFDGIFNSKTTIWDALVQIMQPAGAAPLPDGQKMSAISDGRKALRTQFFSDANMTAGSFQLGYQFDKPGDYDGFKVEYRDPVTFAAAYAVWPVGAADPDQVTLMGCTDATQAGQYARLLWQKRLRQRKSCQWETELEGLIPRFADRIAVASRLPRWGQTGVIVAVAGLAVRTDQPLTWAPSGNVMMLRSETGDPSAVIAATRGGDDDEAILSADPGFAISPGRTGEPSHYSFGTAAEVVRDFTLTNLSHQGGVSTQLQAMIYDPETYTGTLPWLEEAI